MVFGTICNIVYLIQDSTLEACVGKYIVYWVGSVRNGNIQQNNVGNHFQNVIREIHLKISKKLALSGPSGHKCEAPLRVEGTIYRTNVRPFLELQAPSGPLGDPQASKTTGPIFADTRFVNQIYRMSQHFFLFSKKIATLKQPFCTQNFLSVWLRFVSSALT